MGFNAKHQDGTSYWHASTPADGLDSTCGGTAILRCQCGGDQCVCGNFGEAECPGCEECDDEDRDAFDMSFDDSEEQS